MNFVKMHGLGNDFIILDLINSENLRNLDFTSLALKLCDRRFGIGADGIVLVLPSKKDDVKMRIFNSDGSEPEMCGNGIRCFAKYVYEKGIVNKQKIKVETLAGTIVPELNINKGKIESVTVDMGVPRLNADQIPMQDYKGKVVSKPIQVDGTTYKITAVSMGNPHCVIFVDDLETIDLRKIGPKIENHTLFPNKTNVEFVKVEGPEEVTMKVWERGAGITQACGTGACATVVASVLNQKTDKKAKVNLPGGPLFIEWADDGRVYMTGPAETVFEGKLTQNLKEV